MNEALHPEWIIPDWPAPPQVRACVTTRAGGVSKGPWAGLNLGLRTDDDPVAVAENRARLEACLPQPPGWLTQVHGSSVVNADTLRDVLQADASVAREPCTVCAIQVADCLPVLFTDRAGSCVAAAHAGWRGLAGGVLANTVERMDAAPENLLAWIGPGIGPAAFEVGEDVLQAFAAVDPENRAAFQPLREGKWLCDLPALARSALLRCGVTAIYGGHWCTYSDQQRFYSYRRDRVTGRMAALIWKAARRDE
ncbi:MAG: peptidoglycan editing factor PgeF [Burkholderiales bacterium]|nr:peptidoglycan editing factor PgeF [Burkholderiales bacterium]